MMFGSPSRSQLRCEACGTHRRAAVESQICQLIYTYSCCRSMSNGSMIGMRWRCAGRARLRVPITSKNRSRPFASSAVAVWRKSQRLRAGVRGLFSGGGERGRRGGSAIAGGVGRAHPAGPRA